MKTEQLDLEIDLPDKLFFRIGEVSELVGVEPHVLRYWESEFKMRPQRSESGQRMYQRRDIAKFLRIRHLVHQEGFTIAGARKALSGATEATPSMDTEQIQEVAQHLGALRDRIRQARDRFAHALAAPHPAED
ncbi:MAG: MerR family transcriptional regulator [Deltaproteobacteria bacterium]|nr:MerR family transcriptional regulator [Deltaproteobacteria bacterium]